LLDTESGTFQGRLESLLDSSMNEPDNDLAKAQVLFFMYFDEAHVLTQGAPGDPPPPRSKYHLLGRVLAKMNTLRFFVVFLSTNSWLGSFALSTSKIPSLRDWHDTVLHAPFTELPFDTFAENSFAILSKANPTGVRLLDVCDLDYLVKFGRPL
jgi:hypothetical protein